MTVSSFFCRPANASGINADVAQLQQINGAVADDPTDNSYYLGSRLQGTFQIPQVVFQRFEVNIPEGATIVGVDVGGVTAGGDSTGILKISGGLTKRLGGPRPWEGPSGVAIWAIDNQIPMAEYNTIVGWALVHTNLYGNAPAFESAELIALPIAFGNDRVTFGEGTLPGYVEVGGLISQLTDYLEEHEDTRGDTQADSISLMYQFYVKQFDGQDSKFQWMWAEDDLNDPETYEPRLRIDWISTPVGTIEGEADLQPPIQASTSVSPAVEARVELAPAVRASSEVSLTVVSKSEMIPLIEGE